MASDDKKAQAEQLKAEGNAFHAAGNHAAARSKYTDAIKLDGDNAVLYANRAATYIALKQYLDAAKDAQKAVDLDPKYGKAWARLGKSTYEIHLYEQSIDAWKRALETLPPADLSAQETQLKAQYEEGLKLAETALQTITSRIMDDANRLRTIPKDVKPPWIIALEMEDVLTAKNVLNSCAWPLMNAYKDYAEGVRFMKQITKTETGVEGNLNALQAIVGGLLRDQRVFHMDSPDWVDLLQLQVDFELAAFGGWGEGGVETVKEEAVKLLKEKGWRAVRVALAATVRAWFLRAYFAHKSGQSIDVAMQYYNSVVDVLEWGARTWHDVPTSDRGYIFLKSYIRATKRIRMEAYLSALRQAEGESEYSVEELIDMANEMVDETTKNIPKEGDESPMDKGAWYSFHVYPVADAHATLGAVFLQQGLSAKRANDAEGAERMLAAAAKFYKQAAEMYPPDDELFPYFLKVAFEAEWHRGRPLAETLPLCDRFRRALPAVEKIWMDEPSTLLHPHVRQLIRWETQAYAGLLQDRYRMETASSDIPLAPTV
ncbi:TPR-like protein [Daedaleopsis nitida]|nr:TPR-like protein [Daedaleopsis nitida]